MKFNKGEILKVPLLPRGTDSCNRMGASWIGIVLWAGRAFELSTVCLHVNFLLALSQGFVFAYCTFQFFYQGWVRTGQTLGSYSPKSIVYLIHASVSWVACGWEVTKGFSVSVATVQGCKLPQCTHWTSIPSARSLGSVPLGHLRRVSPAVSQNRAVLVLLILDVDQGDGKQNTIHRNISNS